MEGSPRIQGKVGEIESPEELRGKFCFQLFMSFIGSGAEPELIATHGPFDTRDMALLELRRATKIAVDQLQIALGGEPNGKYIDLKDNKIKDFHDEN